MPTCPQADGWELVSHPDMPTGYRKALSDEISLWRTLHYDRERIGEYRWETAKGVLPTQGNCGQTISLSVGFSYDESSAHTINIGALFNVPGLGENAEISGGYQYSWGSASGTATGGEVVVGERNYEYMITPLVLSFRLGEQYSYDSFALNLSVPNIIHTLRSGRFSNPITTVKRTLIEWENPIYIRGGMLVCRRPCG